MKDKNIIKISKELILTLENINGSFNNVNIDCNKLIDYNNKDIRDSKEFETTFNKLQEIKGPTLYWFEIAKSNFSNEELRNKLIEYKNSKESKSTPALKNKYKENSNCLYVGKVKRLFYGRVIQHLGYFKTKATQGLQLFYWANELDLQLKLHYYEFEEEMTDLVSIFEIIASKKLNPIIGKH